MQGPGSFLLRFSPYLNGFTFDLHFDVVRVKGYLEVSLVPFTMTSLAFTTMSTPLGRGIG